MITVIRGVLILVALIVAAASAAMTFAYGLIFVAGWERHIYASLFAAADCAKFMLPTLASHQADTGRRFRSVVTFAIYVFLVVVSASFHIGLIMKAKDNDAGDAKTAHSRYEQAVDEQKALKAQLAALGVPRGAGAIKADIDIVERDGIFTDPKRSNQCTNDTAPESRTLCDKWRKLKGEKENAAAYAELSAKKERADLKVANLNTAEAFKKADAASEQIGEALGVPPATTLLIIALLIATVVEVCSSLLLDMAVSTKAKPKVAQQEVEQPKVVIAEPSSAPVEEPAEVVTVDIVQGDKQSAPSIDPGEWIKANLRPRKGSTVAYSAVYDRFTEEAGAPVSKIAFTRALEAQGFATNRKGKGGGTTIMDATTVRLAMVG